MVSKSASRAANSSLKKYSSSPLLSGSRSMSQCAFLRPVVSHCPRTSRPLRCLVLSNFQTSRCAGRPFSTAREPSKTPLYGFHVAHGAKMVPFGGYSMPVQYSDMSIGESTLWTRDRASVFDVSHMVQHNLSGPGAQGLLSKITPAALNSLPNYHSTLSCLLHPKTGGIVDDCVITRLGPEHFYFVTNAGCREKDLAYFDKNIKDWTADGKPAIEWKVLENQGLVAVQGPLAAKLLQNLLVDMTEDDLSKIHFGQCKYIKFRAQTSKATTAFLVSRGGYTGEDGFEISIPPEETTPFVEFLMTTAGPENLRLAGLGARDSLRLEAGMCLYGHDLDDTTTPVEAGLSWIIGKDRRTAGDFNGADTIIHQLTPASKGGAGSRRRRVGLVIEGAPAREGADIVDSEGNNVGKVTSGCPSPTLKQNIAMGYVQFGKHRAGTELSVVVRGKQRKSTVTKMPFVPSKFYKG